MDLSITLATLLPFVMSCLAAPAALNEDMLRSLINIPPKGGSTPDIPSATTTTNSNDNIITNIELSPDQPIKSVKDLETALTASVKSQLMTSFANMSPEQVSTITGSASPTEFSQLNLMGGINNLVSLIVRQILQSLLPRILGQNQTPATNAGFPMGGGFQPQPQPQQPAGGMFGSLSSMFPMTLMFSFMDNML